MTDALSSEALTANVEAQQRVERLGRQHPDWVDAAVARNARADHPVHGLSAVSSQLLVEREKVTQALAIIDDYKRAEAECRDGVFYGSDHMERIEAILRGAGEGGQPGGEK